MARKTKEIQLQQEIETQEEWEDMLSKEGLCVVDVYQEWSGPVTPLVQNLRRLKNELGDDLLKFFVAKADSIDALEKYRGKCEPCFLFFAGGVLVAVIRGANAPLILRTITEQLAQEHKVLDGQAERKQIKDTAIVQTDAGSKLEDEEEEMKEEPVKEISVVIIKPDAVQSGNAEEIMTEMRKRGIEILRQEERQLTEDEVKNIYVHLQDEPFFHDLVTYMTSSPCIVLAITKGKTGENIIKEFRELIGPNEVEEAKTQAPTSLRAKYGSGGYMNAVHSSDSTDTAARELAFFFPDFVAPKVEGQTPLQRTLALIRPDAYKKYQDGILAKIKEAGFKVAMQKEVCLTKQQAENFYSEHKGEEYFEELTTRMSSGPLLALGLAREDAIKGWRAMLGPTKVDEAKTQEPESLRAQFALEGTQINMLHGSESEDKAKKELEFFFPVEQTVAAIKPDAYGTKEEIIKKVHEAGFRIAARKETILSREIVETLYSDLKDKEYFEELVNHMTSGPTYFMVLSREGAVDGWRSLIGPTDPSKAKAEAPETIRAQLGYDFIRNAVHGSSNPEHASFTISTIFGELTFNKDGTVREEDEDTKVQDTKASKTESQEKKPAEQEQQESIEAPSAQDTEAKVVVPETEVKEAVPKAEAKEDVPETEVKVEKTKTPEPQLHMVENPIEQAEQQEENVPQQPTEDEQKPTEIQQSEEQKPAESQQNVEQKPAESQQNVEQKPVETEQIKEIPVETTVEPKQEEAHQEEAKGDDIVPNVQEGAEADTTAEGGQ